MSQFLVLGQHVGADVNEWLMIRNSHPEFFRWLPIGRFIPAWFGDPLPAAGVMEAIKGNIGAIPLFPADAAFLLSLRFFPQHARRSKNGARGSLGERMIYRSEVTRFTCALLPTILAKTNSPAT